MDKDMMYQCLECNGKEIVKSNDHSFDGRRCKQCGGHLLPRGFVLVGVDLVSGPDRTGYVVTARDKTIGQLRMIADDLEKGCGGFNYLIGIDLASEQIIKAISPP